MRKAKRGERELLTTRRCALDEALTVIAPSSASDGTVFNYNLTVSRPAQEG